MNGRSLLGRAFRVAFGPLALTGALMGVAPGGAVASASPCASWTGLQPPNVGSRYNFLQDVAVLSPCRAWAVGYYNNGTAVRTLIERWNGSAWTVVPSPNVGGSSSDNYLKAVAATSSSNAWAVGYESGKTLIEHWNGSAWAVVPGPAPGALLGVAATSASNAWAVGNDSGRTLIEHWNGTSWKVVPSPSPPENDDLLGVGATSATNAWAVGRYYPHGKAQTLIEHWNGTSWKHVPSPNPSGSSHNNYLAAVAVTTTSNAWAVGDYETGSSTAYTIVDHTLIEHWNGTSWKHVPSQDPETSPGSENVLYGVAATSSNNAWAVGITNPDTLIEHWNGNAWTVAPSPNPSSYNNALYGVAAASGSNVWAVGEYYNSTAKQDETLAVHCC